MNFKAVAQLVALVLYLGAWWVKKAFGWDVQPSVLVAVGGMLVTFIMHAPAMTGKWAPTIAKVLGVAFACVAVAFTVAPVETAGALKLSDQIAATEVIVNPTPAEPDASNEAAPSVAPDVIGGISEATDAPETLLTHPDASPATVPAVPPVLTTDIIGAKPVTDTDPVIDPKTNEPSGAGQGLDTAGQ